LLVAELVSGTDAVRLKDATPADILRYMMRSRIIEQISGVLYGGRVANLVLQTCGDRRERWRCSLFDIAADYLCRKSTRLPESIARSSIMRRMDRSPAASSKRLSMMKNGHPVRAENSRRNGNSLGQSLSACLELRPSKIGFWQVIMGSHGA
jgi:hypothetical protein